MPDEEVVKDQDQNESPEQKQDKEEKKFQQGMQKLMALLNGDKTLSKKAKIKNDRIGTLVQKATEERVKKIEEDFVTKALALFDSWAEFDKKCLEDEKIFKQAIANKKKEFLGKMNDLFQMVESIDKLTGQYTASLKKVVGEGENNA